MFTVEAGVALSWSGSVGSLVDSEEVIFCPGRLACLPELSKVTQEALQSVAVFSLRGKMEADVITYYGSSRVTNKIECDSVLCRPMKQLQESRARCPSC